MARNPWATWPFGWGGLSPEQPLSGDVSQWIRVFSPTVTVNGSGDPVLEGEIVRDVATYGAQLGPISAITLALAQGEPPPAEALIKLRTICAEIEDKKAQYRKTAADRARKALAELKEHDPDEFAALLAEHAAEVKGPGSAGAG